MSFKGLNLKKGWDSDEDNILDEFYKPALSCAVLYKRLAGFFSSTTFAITVRETLDFIEHGGLMNLVTSVELSEQDIQTIEASIRSEDIIEKDLIKKLKENQDEITKKCTSLFGWMLSNKINGRPQLEIKIAVPRYNQGNPNSIYHQKLGIFYDREGNVITFSGSVNETGKAWMNNIENFKVSLNWRDTSDMEAVNFDIRQFEKFWSNSAKRTEVYELPVAVKEHLLRIRPKSNEEFQVIISELKSTFKGDLKKPLLELRDYQVEAIKNWENHNFRGLFEMATGTGKTFVALGCINRLQKSHKRFVVIIASPQTHLVEQWMDKINQWNSEIKEGLRLHELTVVPCFHDNPGWKFDLERAISDFNTKSFGGDFFSNGFYILTTHSTLANPEFIEKIQRVNGDVLLIVDEVHAVGSEIRRNSLLDKYQFRIGLSATPYRHLDNVGNLVLIGYFGDIVYRFDLRDAIKKGILVPYDYLPYYAELTQEELGEYRSLTRKIAIKLSKGQDLDELQANFVEGERANIIATASRKYDVFEQILDSSGNKLSDTLVYCHEKQVLEVTRILSGRFIVNDTITWKDPTSERLKILNNFTNRHFDSIVAIKCLDEGIDIPSAATAIILASTGNPRQYIQRRGRILRRNDKSNKNKATIFDIIVIPPISGENDDISKMERKIVAKELLRHKEFAEISLNKDEALQRIRRITETFDIDFDSLSEEYIRNLD